MPQATRLQFLRVINIERLRNKKLNNKQSNKKNRCSESCSGFFLLGLISYPSEPLFLKWFCTAGTAHH